MKKAFLLVLLFSCQKTEPEPLKNGYVWLKITADCENTFVYRSDNYKIQTGGHFYVPNGINGSIKIQFPVFSDIIFYRNSKPVDTAYVQDKDSYKALFCKSLGK